jgi:hypothetical protein
MRHQCGTCLSEFFDDASSSSPSARVFCAFCGARLPARADERTSAVPFSADFPREESFALGVIGKVSSEFPDTLKQFRAHGSAERKPDSLSPLETAPEEPTEDRDLPPWRTRRFWTSLAVGFAVGALGAAVLGKQRSAAAPKPPRVSAAVAAPQLTPVVTPSPTGCPKPTAETASPPPPPASAKPAVTPVLERRFWLERARSAQREYHLIDAERFYRRVLALSPHDSEALVGVGELERLRAAPEAAEARFREALETDHNYVPALVALADLAWESGQTEDARRQYREIIEQYSVDLYPPYVAQRLAADACVPRCR